MVRIRLDRDLPRHFEASPLKPRVKVVGWLLAVVLCFAGIAAFVGAGSMTVEAAAAVLTLAGGSLAVGLFRCRRYEITVGERMIELRLGPFRSILPAGCVSAASALPATSWRRLFADRELQLELSIGSRRLVVPARDEDELRAALLQSRTASRSGGAPGHGHGA